MIYDLIQLPMRNISGDLTTVCPLFTRLTGMEDVDWYGRVINLDRAKSTLFKYKSIEPIGDAVFERLFLTTDQIDFKKKWITSDIEIFPIFFKVFRRPFNPYCNLYRYLNGTLNALGSIDGFSHMQTLDNKLMKLMWPYDPGCFIPKRTYDLIPQIVQGTDSENLEKYQSVKTFMECDDTIDYPQPYNKIFPEFPTDHAEKMFLNNMCVSDMRPIIAPQCNVGIYRNTMLQVNPPFEINNTTIFSEDNEFYRWSLHELIQNIERSVFTDIHLTLFYKEANKVEAKTEFYSRYIGMTPKRLPGEESFASDAVEKLRKWANMTTGETPLQVELWKNWAEEIFITIKTSKGDQNYYFDLALYSLANLSFVDIIG